MAIAACGTARTLNKPMTEGMNSMAPRIRNVRRVPTHGIRTSTGRKLPAIEPTVPRA